MTPQETVFPLTEFIAKLESFCETPQKDAIVYHVKNEIYFDYDKAKELFIFIKMFKEQFPNYKVELKGKIVELGPAFYHAGRISRFFQENTTKEDLIESMSFLLKQGWSEEQFGELGMSRSTFYRYQAKTKK